MEKFRKLFGLFVVAVAVVACGSTPKSKLVGAIQMGMQKSDVLEVAGNPTRTARQHGQDRWTYEYDSESGKKSQYVYFADGKVSYIGPTEAPSAPTARGEFKPVGN